MPALVRSDRGWTRPRTIRYRSRRDCPITPARRHHSTLLGRLPSTPMRLGRNGGPRSSGAEVGGKCKSVAMRGRAAWFVVASLAVGACGGAAVPSGAASLHAAVTRQVRYGFDHSEFVIAKGTTAYAGPRA